MKNDVENIHAVIRFKRAVSFPRFSMAKGERWGFVVHEKTLARLNAIKNGDRFDFAGGQCLAEDVELIYEGPGDINYSIAAGYCKAPVAEPQPIQQTPQQEKSMGTTNEWRCEHKEAEYIDFERELAGFSDEGNSSVDMRLTFVKKGHSAYLTLLRMNDDGEPRELGGPINLSWEEGLRQLGDSPTLLQELSCYCSEQVTSFTVYVEVTGEASDEEDEGVAGVYSGSVTTDRPVCLDSLSPDQEHAIAAAVLDEFHSSLAIGVLDDFDITLILPNGQPIAENDVTEAHASFDGKSGTIPAAVQAMLAVPASNASSTA